MAKKPNYQQAVSVLICYKSIENLFAQTMISEIGDVESLETIPGQARQESRSVCCLLHPPKKVVGSSDTGTNERRLDRIGSQPMGENQILASKEDQDRSVQQITPPMHRPKCKEIKKADASK